MNWSQGIALVFLLAGAAGAEPVAHARAAEGESHARAHAEAARTHAIHGATNEADQNQGTDGTKLFTGDTEVLPVGDWSASLQYFLSLANGFFDDTGELTSLGGTRRSEQFIGSVTTGVVPNVDLTFLAAGSRIHDFSGESSDPAFVPLGPARGAGLTGAGLLAHWRLYKSVENGRSVSISGGPSVLGQLLEENGSYKPGATFSAWNQSAVFRQDFNNFSTNLEVFYTFPLMSSPNTFHSYGANLALGYDANDFILPVVELNYQKTLPAQGLDSESLGASVGLILKPTPNLALSLGVQKTIAGRNLEGFTTYTLGGSMQF